MVYDSEGTFVFNWVSLQTFVGQVCTMLKFPVHSACKPFVGG